MQTLKKKSSKFGFLYGSTLVFIGILLPVLFHISLIHDWGKGITGYIFLYMFPTLMILVLIGPDFTESFEKENKGIIDDILSILIILIFGAVLTLLILFALYLSTTLLKHLINLI